MKTCAASCDPAAIACCGADQQPCCPGQQCAEFHSCQSATNTCKYVCGGNACADAGFDDGYHCSGNTQLQCKPPFDKACSVDVLIPSFCCPVAKTTDCGTQTCDMAVGTCM